MINEKSEQIANRLKEILKKKGWNRARFARELGTCTKSIGKYLSGEHNFTIRTLFEIEEVTGEQVIEAVKSSSSVKTKRTHTANI